MAKRRYKQSERLFAAASRVRPGPHDGAVDHRRVGIAGGLDQLDPLDPLGDLGLAGGSDPFLGGGRRMFRTRDLGRWTPDGQLEHLGVELSGDLVMLVARLFGMQCTPHCWGGALAIAATPSIHAASNVRNCGPMLTSPVPVPHPTSRTRLPVSK